MPVETPVGRSSLLAAACLGFSMFAGLGYLAVDQAVWSPVAIMLALGAGVMVAGGDWIGRVVIEARRIGASPRLAGLWACPIALVRGCLLGVWWFLIGIGSWNAGDLLCGGKMSAAGRLGLAGSIGLLAGVITAWFVLATARAWVRWGRRIVLGLAFVVAAGLVFLYLTRTGADDPAKYLPREQSPYRLPFPAGTTWLCSQGNWGVISHRNGDEYAYDFAMPIGNDICAARAGAVVGVVDQHDGNGLRGTPGNIVTIQHEDRSYALYVHVRQGGSFVKVGDRVRRGQRIASSGNVGFSTAPHLHFEVRDVMFRSMPITFADVESDRGIPRMFKRYTSWNTEE